MEGDITRAEVDGQEHAVGTYVGSPAADVLRHLDLAHLDGVGACGCAVSVGLDGRVIGL